MIKAFSTGLPHWQRDDCGIAEPLSTDLTAEEIFFLEKTTDPDIYREYDVEIDDLGLCWSLYFVTQVKTSLEKKN